MHRTGIAEVQVTEGHWPLLVVTQLPTSHFSALKVALRANQISTLKMSARTDQSADNVQDQCPSTIYQKNHYIIQKTQ